MTLEPDVGRSSSAHLKRVLVVEDDHLVALDIQRHVERMGHDVVVAHSGQEAIDKAHAVRLDLILMDIKLGGAIDGIEAARVIRSSLDLPIIYLTAYADNQTVDRARQTEPYGYVMKPFQERELKATIAMALHRHSTDARRTEQQLVQRFLSDATSILTSSLDYQTVARRAADLLVPHYADWCAIQLREKPGSAPALVVTKPEDLVPANHAPVIDNVLRTGREELITHLDDRESLRQALGGSCLDTLRAIGARSLICVPLVARTGILGALALVSGRVHERFRTEDLAFASDFAHRLAIALDNALLYRSTARAIEMRDDVLAIVSHDLRTPLGVIMMQAATLVADPTHQRVGSSIEQAAHQMNRLIGDLLDATALNAGQLALDIGSHDACEIVHETVGMFVARAHAGGLALSEECAEGLPPIRCDRDRIIQVLSNLIGNALKFTARGGTVRATARMQGDRVQLSVEDTGRGIPPEQVPHLFERFWRAQGKAGGVGLGLFIAQGIVSAHGGALGIDSTVGVGTRFFFSVPTR